MTINEAIKELHDYLFTPGRRDPAKFNESVQLGYEALLREQNKRKLEPSVERFPLPSETQK